MKFNDWIISNTKVLTKAGITSARLDCLILLEDATGKDRAWLLAHPDYDVKGRTFHTLERQIKRRVAHEPLAYIRGKSEFYGREFSINAHTLQPRPETETMIDLLKQVVVSRQSSVVSQEEKNKKTPTRDKRQATRDRSLETGDNNLTIIDVGTGSGCIAITAKLEIPQATVYAIDIDKACIETAKKNAKTHNTDIEFHQGNLLEPITNLSAGLTYAESGADLFLSSRVSRINNTMHEQHKGKSDSDPQTNSKITSSAGEQIVGGTLILLANLPYVPDGHTINQAAMHEPRHAIFGGIDGLDYYRALFEQATKLNQLPKYIFTEALPPQHKTLEEIASTHGYQQIDSADFIQVFSAGY